MTTIIGRLKVNKNTIQLPLEANVCGDSDKVQAGDAEDVGSNPTASQFLTHIIASVSLLTNTELGERTPLPMNVDDDLSDDEIGAEVNQTKSERASQSATGNKRPRSTDLQQEDQNKQKKTMAERAGNEALEVQKQMMKMIEELQMKNEQMQKMVEEAQKENKFLVNTIREQQAGMVATKDGFVKVTRGKKPLTAAVAGPSGAMTSNRFDALEVEMCPDQPEQEQGGSAAPVTASKRQKRLAPVYVHLNPRQVNDVLAKHRITPGAEDLKIAGVGKQKARVTPKTVELRDAITKALGEDAVEHLVFKNSDEWPFKAVLYGMGDYTVEEVTELLARCEAIPTKPLAVVRMTRQRDGEHQELPYFTCSFPPETKLAQLQGLRSLNNIICGFREHYNSKGPRQCNKCQRYGHLRANCYMKPRCVKCGLGHESSVCPVITADSPREHLCCVLCGEKGHPANYSGCKIAVEERRRQEERSSHRRPRQQQQQRPQQRAPLSRAEEKRRFGNVNHVPTVVNTMPALQGAWGQQKWPQLNQQTNGQQQHRVPTEQRQRYQFASEQRQRDTNGFQFEQQPQQQEQPNIAELIMGMRADMMGMMQRMVSVVGAKIQLSSQEMNSIFSCNV